MGFFTADIFLLSVSFSSFFCSSHSSYAFVSVDNVDRSLSATTSITPMCFQQSFKRRASFSSKRKGAGNVGANLPLAWVLAVPPYQPMASTLCVSVRINNTHRIKSTARILRWADSFAAHGVAGSPVKHFLSLHTPSISWQSVKRQYILYGLIYYRCHNSDSED